MHSNEETTIVLIISFMVMFYLFDHLLLSFLGVDGFVKVHRIAEDKN